MKIEYCYKCDKGIKPDEKHHIINGQILCDACYQRTIGQEILNSTKINSHSHNINDSSKEIDKLSQNIDTRVLSEDLLNDVSYLLKEQRKKQEREKRNEIIASIVFFVILLFIIVIVHSFWKKAVKEEGEKALIGKQGFINVIYVNQ